MLAAGTILLFKDRKQNRNKPNVIEIMRKLKRSQSTLIHRKICFYLSLFFLKHKTSKRDFRTDGILVEK